MPIDAATVQWLPLANYAGAHHVLFAAAQFVHPGNGNQYFYDCVQISGARQNVSISRLVAKTQAWETIVTFQGTKNAEAGFERGGCFIGQGGALNIATTMTPLGVPHVTETGFQGMRCSIPGVDDPWGGGSGTDPLLIARIDAIDRMIAAHTAIMQNMQRQIDGQAATIESLEILVAHLGSSGGTGGLTVEQLADLHWLSSLRALLRT